MSPDRKALLEYVWSNLYAERCRCGRCDCASSNPVELARRVLVGFGRSFAQLQHLERGRAEVYVELRKNAKERVGRELGWPETQAAHERNARRFARAAQRMYRLSIGWPPFIAHPEES